MSKYERDMQIVVDYCRENIEDFESKVQTALRRIDHDRAPLSMVYREFANEIEDAIDDCANDYDVWSDDLSAEDVIFWN